MGMIASEIGFSLRRIKLRRVRLPERKVQAFQFAGVMSRGEDLRLRGYFMPYASMEEIRDGNERRFHCETVISDNARLGLHEVTLSNRTVRVGDRTQSNLSRLVLSGSLPEDFKHSRISSVSLAALSWPELSDEGIIMKKMEKRPFPPIVSRIGRAGIHSLGISLQSESEFPLTGEFESGFSYSDKVLRVCFEIDGENSVMDFPFPSPKLERLTVEMTNLVYGMTLV